MAEMSTTVADTITRTELLNAFRAWASEHFESDCLDVAANEFMMPIINAKGEEKYATITISIPRGTRNRETKTFDPYDGYAAAEEWKEKVEADAKEKAIAAENKARAEKEKERKRNARKIKKIAEQVTD